MDTGIIRDERGRFLPGMQPAQGVITSATARTMAQKRWRKTQQAVATAIMEEIGSNMPNPATTPRDAYAYIVAKQAVTLLDEQHPRMDDVEKLGQIMGEVPRAAELRVQDVQPSATVTLSLSGDALDAVRGLLSLVAQAQRDTVEGEIVGGDE